MAVHTHEDLRAVFTYQAPDADQIAKYEGIRAAALNLAEVIWEVCPPSADRSDAIRKVREAVMTANAAIALEGRG